MRAAEIRTHLFLILHHWDMAASLWLELACSGPGEQLEALEVRTERSRVKVDRKVERW